MFDNGEIRGDEARATRIMQLLHVTFSTEADEKTMVHLSKDLPRQLCEKARLHKDIYAAIAAHSSPGTQRRYIVAMRQYSSGTIAQVQRVQTADNLDFDQVLMQRRQSVCVSPLFALVELGHTLNVEDMTFQNALIQRLETLGIEVTLSHNDLLSYIKEEMEGVPHNAVAACRAHGITAQEALHHVGTEANRRLKELEAVADTLNGNSGHTKDALDYVQGIKDVVKANLYWSLESDRFFSKEQKHMLVKEGAIEIAGTCC